MLFDLLSVCAGKARFAWLIFAYPFLKCAQVFAFPCSVKYVVGGFGSAEGFLWKIWGFAYLHVLVGIGLYFRPLVRLKIYTKDLGKALSYT